MAEQMSWRKPGRVTSAVRAPPPMVALASITSTRRPARPRVMAAASPLGPDPTTTASYALKCFAPVIVGSLTISVVDSLLSISDMTGNCPAPLNLRWSMDHDYLNDPSFLFPQGEP